MQRTASPSRATSMEDLLDPRLAARLGSLDISSRKIFSGKLQGERRSKKRGESVEFADHRPYAAGDDLRHIDWNIYARLDQLFMKMFLEEEDLSLHLVLDASASTDCGEPGKFLFMQRLTMALATVGLVNLNRVAVTTLGGVMPTNAHAQSPSPAPVGEVSAPRTEGVGGGSPEPASYSIRDLRGRRRMRDLSEFLLAIEPGGVTDFTGNAKRLALSRRGRGVMVVISDFFMREGYESGLRLLTGRGYDVFAVQVMSPQETDPDIAGDLRLRDVEDAGTAEVTITAPLLKKYRQTLAAYNTGLTTFCARREIGRIAIRSDTPLDSLLLDTLRRRGLLR